jgi:prephenate dehydrogenase
MDLAVPRATLLAQPREPVPRTLVARLLTRLNGGEDHLFTEKIAREAKAHGAQLVFVHLPMFEGPQTVSDESFLKQFGLVLNYGDLAPHDELFENWSHLNHAGAMKASARVAAAIAGLNL